MMSTAILLISNGQLRMNGLLQTVLLFSTLLRAVLRRLCKRGGVAHLLLRAAEGMQGAQQQQAQHMR
jgi:hypothetical protein